MKFLKENWLWIAIPFVVALVGLVLLILIGGGDGSGVAPFQYNVS